MNIIDGEMQSYFQIPCIVERGNLIFAYPSTGMPNAPGSPGSDPEAEIF
jgi:hypothetical protein